MERTLERRRGVEFLGEPHARKRESERKRRHSRASFRRPSSYAQKKKKGRTIVTTTLTFLVVGEEEGKEGRGEGGEGKDSCSLFAKTSVPYYKIIKLLY